MPMKLQVMELQRKWDEKAANLSITKGVTETNNQKLWREIEKIENLGRGWKIVVLPFILCSRNARIASRRKEIRLNHQQLSKTRKGLQDLAAYIRVYFVDTQTRKNEDLKSQFNDIHTRIMQAKNTEAVYSEALSHVQMVVDAARLAHIQVSDKEMMNFRDYNEIGESAFGLCRLNEKITDFKAYWEKTFGPKSAHPLSADDMKKAYDFDGQELVVEELFDFSATLTKPFCVREINNAKLELLHTEKHFAELHEILSVLLKEAVQASEELVAEKNALTQETLDMVAEADAEARGLINKIPRLCP